MEFTLRVYNTETLCKALGSLNPCFCGIYSQRISRVLRTVAPFPVLILVFVEFTLRDSIDDFKGATQSGLNPCFCGIYSQRIEEKAKSLLKFVS